MQFLTRESLLAKAERRIKAVELGDGRAVRIRTLNELEHSAYESAVWRKTKRGWEMDGELLQEQRRRLVLLCVCNEAGQPLLTDDDLDALGAVDGGLIRRLAFECRKHCGLDDPTADEGDEKNLPETPA
jgi:hypothetical protein